MRGTLAAAVAAVVFATGAGCTLILGGNKDYHEIDGGGAAGGSGGGATTTVTTASGGGGTGGASTSSSGTGGDAGSTCRLLHDAEDCGAAKRCTIVTPSIGATGCVPLAANPAAKFAACGNDDTICPAGTMCDGYSTSVCKPFCTTSADCGGAICTNVAANDGTLIPGVGVCVAHCDPVTADPCGSGVTCQYTDTNKGPDFECYDSQGKGEGNPCDPQGSIGQCGKGLLCLNAVCTRWCHPANAPVSIDCAGGGSCGAFSNITPKYNNVEYGYCL